tara:strand:- start:9631 stop:10371 length:741 start_codon:yes stop_codon:yes gene_type:complete
MTKVVMHNLTKGNFMKAFSLVFLILLMQVAHASTPIEVEVPITHIYSPKGFDSNDMAEVVISGFLPNLCHKSPTLKAKVEDKTIYIQATALNYEPENPFCPEMVVPFLSSVDVGVLDRGDYEVKVNINSPYEAKGALFISESMSPSVDEHTYAYVDHAVRVSGSRFVRFNGYNPSDCFVLDKVDFVDNGTDVYSVLPKMKQISDHCPMKMVPFSFAAEIPKKLSAKQVLLHIRVMNGKSVNHLFKN